MEIKIEINELTREIYRFYYMDNTIYLSEYYLMQKESKNKRTYKTILRYDRIMNRSNNIEESDIVLTDELKKQALEIFVSNIKVKKWSERGK